MSITVYRLDSGDSCVKRAIRRIDSKSMSEIQRKDSIQSQEQEHELADIPVRQSLLLSENGDLVTVVDETVKDDETDPNTDPESPPVEKDAANTVKTVQIHSPSAQNVNEDAESAASEDEEEEQTEEHPHVVNACYGIMFVVAVLALIIYMIACSEDYKKAYLYVEMPPNNTFEGHLILDNEQFKTLADEMDELRALQFKLMTSLYEKAFAPWKIEMNKKAREYETAFYVKEKIFNSQALLRRQIRNQQSFSLSDPRTKMNVASYSLFYGALLFYVYVLYKTVAKINKTMYAPSTELEYNKDGSVKRRVTILMELFGVGVPVATAILILSFAISPNNVTLDDKWECKVFTSCD